MRSTGGASDASRRYAPNTAAASRYVTEYLVGFHALFERLAGWVIGRAILNTLAMKRSSRGYRVPWDQLDLSDPAKPRLKCAVADLEPIDKQ
jgi:hypothetical protein